MRLIMSEGTLFYLGHGVKCQEQFCPTRGLYALRFVVLGVMRYNVHVYMTLGKYQSNTGHLAVNCYRLETGIISVEFGRSVSYD